jgi:hypothetical protein
MNIHDIDFSSEDTAIKDFYKALNYIYSYGNDSAEGLSSKSEEAIKINKAVPDFDIWIKVCKAVENQKKHIHR